MLFAISRASDWDGSGQPCEGAVKAFEETDQDGGVWRTGWTIRIPEDKVMDFVEQVGCVVIYPKKSEASLQLIDQRNLTPEQRAYEKLQAIVIYDDWLE